MQPRKKRPLVAGTPVQVRLQPDALDRLDAWIGRQDDEPTRPEAVRRLMEQALATVAVPIKGKRK